MTQLSGASMEQVESDLTRNKMLEGEWQRLRGDYAVGPGDLHLVMQEVRSGGNQTSKKSERVHGWEVWVGLKTFWDGRSGQRRG